MAITFSKENIARARGLVRNQRQLAVRGGKNAYPDVEACDVLLALLDAAMYVITPAEERGR